MLVPFIKNKFIIFFILLTLSKFIIVQLVSTNLNQNIVHYTAVASVMFCVIQTKAYCSNQIIGLSTQDLGSGDWESGSKAHFAPTWP